MKIYQPLLIIFCLTPLFAKAQWYQAPALNELKLSAPFKNLIDHKKKNPESEMEVDANLAINEKNIPVRIKIRGHTNFDDGECSFPKLTLKFKDAAVNNTVFSNVKKIKLGTHCGDDKNPETWLTPKGRIRNEIAITREAFVYEIIRSLEVPTLQSRIVTMTYIDTDTKSKITKKGMLLEDDEEMAKRIKAEKINYTENSVDGPLNPSLPIFTDATSLKIDLQSVAETLLIEALVGNHDHGLRISSEDQTESGIVGLYNIYIFQKMPSSQKISIPYDFDISSAVTGISSLEMERPFINLDILGGIDIISYAMLRKIQNIRLLIPSKQMKEAIKKFVANKSFAYALLDKGFLDPEGKKRIKSMMDFFFQSITNNFDLPRIKDTKGIAVYHDDHGKKLCGKLPKDSIYIELKKNQRATQIQPIVNQESNDGCFGKGPFWMMNDKTKK